MRDPCGDERSTCQKCAAQERECNEFLPDNLDTDKLDNGDFDWEAQTKDLDRQKVGGDLALALGRCFMTVLVAWGELQSIIACSTSSYRQKLHNMILHDELCNDKL